ncbi:MAG: hypothetical protein ACREQF_01135, partial [Candidatus Binataceae bacterium]
MSALTGAELDVADATAGERPLRGEDALAAAFDAAHGAGRVARAYLESVREELGQRNLAGARGSEIVRAFTAAVDDLMRALFRFAEGEHARRFPKLSQGIAIAARGGYGRAELNPQSDVDLLFVYD